MNSALDWAAKWGKSYVAAFRGPERRIAVFKLVLGLTWLTCLLIGHRAFLPGREFPVAPMVPWANWDGAWLTILFSLLCAMCAAVILSPKPHKWLSALPIVAILICLGDWTRWQPWMYEFVFLSAALAVTRSDDEKSRERFLAVGAIVLAGIYFHSGIQKANASFVRDVHPFIVGPFIKHAPEFMQDWVQKLGYAAPAMEMFIGAGLLFRPTRKLCVLLGLSMHAMLILSLGPLGNGYNAIVWPWNLGMMALLLVFCWHKRPSAFQFVLGQSRSFVPLSAAALFLIAPLLNFAEKWDDYMSFSLYSSRVREATLYFSPEAISTLPESARSELTDSGIGLELNVFLWSLRDLNMPCYPETRVYKAIVKDLCDRGLGPNDISLVVAQRPNFRTGEKEQITYPCCQIDQGSTR